MLFIETVRALLQREGLPFTQMDFSSERDFWLAYSPHSDLSLADENPVSVLKIDGGHEKAPLYMDFKTFQGGMKLWDLHFGEYDFEIFEYDEADILPVLLREIRAVLAGETHMICTWRNRNRHWRGDARFHVSPGDEDDQSAAFESAVRKIKRRQRRHRLFGSGVTCAVYSWHSYREFKC